MSSTYPGSWSPSVESFEEWQARAHRKAKSRQLRLFPHTITTERIGGDNRRWYLYPWGLCLTTTGELPDAS